MEESVLFRIALTGASLLLMIKTGETITIEAIALEEKHLSDIRQLPHIFDLDYHEQILTLRCTGAEHNLIRVLNYLQEQVVVSWATIFSSFTPAATSLRASSST